MKRWSTVVSSLPICVLFFGGLVLNSLHLCSFSFFVLVALQQSPSLCASITWNICKKRIGTVWKLCTGEPVSSPIRRNVFLVFPSGLLAHWYCITARATVLRFICWSNWNSWKRQLAKPLVCRSCGPYQVPKKIMPRSILHSHHSSCFWQFQLVGFLVKSNF